jgi:hypothetical protein
MTKIAIIYHTTYGHTKLQAEAVHRGAQSVSSATLYTVAEATARIDELDRRRCDHLRLPNLHGQHVRRHEGLS